jgi:hypothetical protein
MVFRVSFGNTFLILLIVARAALERPCFEL